MRHPAAVVGLAALIGAAVPAWAQTVVDRCTSDVQSGGTRNLATALTQGGHIVFACPAGTSIRMTRSHSVAPGTTLDGESRVTLDAHGARVSLLRASGAITLRRITIQNAALPRSALAARASVLLASAAATLQDVTITGSENPVLVRGNAQVTDSAFLNNTAWALSIDGEADVANSRFIGNQTGLSVKSGRVRGSVFWQNSTGALRVTHPTGRVSVSTSQFIANVGRGAILLSQRSGPNTRATVAVKRNTFTDNQNVNGGGAITILDATLGAPLVALPALMRLPPARFEIGYNRFEGNRGSNGGAINADLNNSGGLVVTGGIFLRNVADGSGGAISWTGASVLLAHSLFRANSAQKGGALFADFRLSGARWVLANSLVAENVVAAGGGAIEVGPLEVFNVTIARNAGVGFAANVHGSPPTAPVVVNAILVENRDGNCRGIAGSAFRGSNLQFGRRDCPGVSFDNPFLDAFYVPALGSAALSAGDVAACRAAPVSRKDLLFQSRATDARCALGAFERPPVRRMSRTPERPGRVP